ncbi:cysteine desulfurase, sulfur acceptor subunit CsdE [Erwinia sp. OLTSP20]|uniref:cysteine desulfurase sulfur acceptor subunit CsdE n=1 Tax=unclassified Erwinia TaxID=2622719 RepID=UPI000C187F5C|nr:MULTISPECIES: cysteine desulfurase sulfur acceptor subunit CsdE [unclassified Erwinia]PIJ49043.1 cysteine desulfurase, sulfur acceptor subunit CsdE [Erwinia sp. OAMSP11]PIJ75037.1 cysteine desulfurase, sulfur acceptor subunit CsdE [Erwinia sp. OLSSP12]PIJ79728.1 cysteine desulfurase, sulfur acceptor subunit CsdE [Erwinia sp. OLCASP19]PIJ80513.1 cysteine desulfurase, sulfur acceptor subunit CsdE [Erwinia sp. OLMTSP26]PIJ82628.1 cysteine desulfurase, sulfur acceptor subunit CsdE [Erwinia sp. 
MNKILLAPHPFGTQITAGALQDQFSAFQHWEDRYRQLILLGKQLPALDEALKQPAIELAGCENRVWLGWQQTDNGTLHFYGDSEGRIVRGLLAVLLTAIEGQQPDTLRRSDPLALFARLGLSQQLSASRSAGLNALADAVRRAADPR